MSAACVVLLRSGMALLVRRGDADVWELPCGAIRAGETASSAAVRILREDFGFEAGPATELTRAGELIGVLVSGGAGELKPVRHAAMSWVESRRILERPLTAECAPIARVLAEHRRRERYKGTHPRSFGEKYKELAGDPLAAAKAAARGSTPAGAHLSVMKAEILEALSPLSGATVLDCTLGWGGHAEALARSAGPEGRVICLDRDGEELERTRRRLDAAGVAVVARQSDYADAPSVLESLGVDGVNALLADLGVSSMQLDRPERGMSFKADGPLDMRMDRSRGITAAQWLERVSRVELAEAFSRYGDEPDAEKVAAALSALAAAGRSPRTTAELAAAVAAAKGLPPRALRKKDASSRHPAARVFQAVRIAVNAERDSLARFLAVLPRLLRPGGRAALLTFHSGEERLVDAALSAQTDAGFWRNPRAAPRKPSPEEVRLNPRARSARLWTEVRA
ncbi:MAG: 16S rRNA (cytosine(1402)-N(4))-methyltransferase RsmH [Elusimicrobia bacterium]|nr:16S rRNA (cytosine(1402)-N(4))-methyltransferase RsmH [Elusimicrobiota bacterium]